MFKTFAKLHPHFDFNQTPVQTDLRSYHDLVDKINRIDLAAYSNDTLKKQSLGLKNQATHGVSPEQLLVPAYALVKEVSARVLGLKPFGVQLIAGIAMHEGKIVEMLTGEGKTLAAVFPAYLNALTAQGVHILTFNDYLAKRDAEWMGAIYNFLGLTVGYIQNDMPGEERKAAYSDDITYLTAREAGFDYLRSFLSYAPSELLQRPFHYAIVDEADSILIDEGRTPLVIAGKQTIINDRLIPLADLVRTLLSGIDYDIDENSRNVYLLEPGINKAEVKLQCGNLYAPHNLALLTSLHNALHAEVLLHRDIDYIIQNGGMELVDEFTGRVVENRHWPDGLQEAVEAKEGLIHGENGKILGSITMQHFLNCYPKIAGMTGTAATAADEFKEFYNLDIVVIPPNRPLIRIDEADKVFTHQAAKFSGLLQDITLIHATGRPILVGTGSIQESEQLARMLDHAGLPHQLLNAKNDELEAKIIAGAGALGAITISTNMAGRGTDIRLGGVDENESEPVKALGGLYVIGVNHFESTRVDKQLRGRAGRHGDPGSSRFYISLEDELIVRHGVKELIPEKYKDSKQEQPIYDPIVGRQIHTAQKIIEAQNFEIRKNLWKYSWIIEKQRRVIHQWRQAVLLDQERPYLFKTVLPERYKQLALRYKENVLEQAEKYVTLYQIDSQWADFLEDVSEIREGIHLVSLSGRIPLNEFHERVMEVYLNLHSRIQQAIIKTLRTVEITENGIAPEKAGLKGPSATWSYMINDTLFSRNLKTALVKRSLNK